MNEILTGIASLVMAPIVFLATFFATPVAAPVIEQPLGVALPSGTALFETSLAAPITNTAVTMTLVSNTVRGGGTLSGYQCFTLSEGTAQTEYVCGTVTGTTVSGLERGLSPSDGVTSVSSLQFSHRRGASVKITDFPLIQRLRSQAAGSGTYEAVLQYAPGVTPTGGSDIVDVEYVTSIITGTSTLSYNRIVVQGTAGETLATGTIVFLQASDSRWYRADNDLRETYVDQTLGIAQGPGTTGSAILGGVLTYGLDTTQRALTPGGFVFLSATAGATSTATTSQVLGKAISATTLFFDQNLIDSSVYVPTTFTATTTFLGTTTFSGPTLNLASSSIKIFGTGSSTYARPANLKHIVLEMVASGGGGGGSPGSSAGQAGNGGGSGGYCKSLIPASRLSATTSLSLGPGGAGGVGTGSGFPGGLASFGGVATATGGGGGPSSGPVSTLGGSSTGCLINGAGAAGFPEGTAGNAWGAGGVGMYGVGNGGRGGGDGGNGENGVDGMIKITEYF